MVRRLPALTATLFLLASPVLTACGDPAPTSSAEGDWSSIRLMEGREVYLLTDLRTGCEYLLASDQRIYPLPDADGTHRCRRTTLE